MATYSSTLALKILWTEELGAGYYPWGRKESGMTEQLHFHSAYKLNKQDDNVWPGHTPFSIWTLFHVWF